jgi:hypothetical protein
MSKSRIVAMICIAAAGACARQRIACECPFPGLRDTLSTLIADHENSSWPNWRVDLIGQDSLTPWGLFLSQALPPGPDASERWRTTDMVPVHDLAPTEAVMFGTCVDAAGAIDLFGIADTSAVTAAGWRPRALWRVAPDSGWRPESTEELVVGVPPPDSHALAHPRCEFNPEVHHWGI